MKFNKFLKVYLWIMVFLIFVAFGFEMTDNESSDIIDYLDYIIWLIALLGVYGYCYGKALFIKIFWKAYLPSLIVWDVYVTSREYNSDPELQEPTVLLIFTILCLVTVVPAYIALYMYVYKNKNT